MIALVRLLVDTLVASVWQGLCVVTITTFALALFGRRLNAATRCSILQAALVALAATPAITTLCRTWRSGVTFGGYGIALASGNGRDRHAAASVAGFHGFLVPLDDRALVILFAAWLAGTAFFLVRIAAASLRSARLIERGERLVDRDGIRVYASRDVTVPLALGLSKAAIVVPVALVAMPEMFACVVLHEIAHLRRGDVWANACERIVHAVLCFNPAVWLLLHRIGLEREVACDDWAVARSHDLDTYTRNLASFAVWRTGALPSLGLQSVGFGRTTIERIHRLEDVRRNGAIALSRSTLGGFTLVFASLALSFVTLVPAIAFVGSPAIASEPAAPAVVASTSCNAPVRYTGGPAPVIGAAEHRPLATKLHIVVSPEGRVVETNVMKPSGDPVFDRAVVTAAKDGTFSPERRNCTAVTGSYVFLAQTAP